MGYFVFMRSGRARKDPGAFFSPKLVDRMTNGIPNSWHPLPLVDYVRSLTREGVAWVCLGNLKVAPAINMRNGCGVSKRAPGFAAPLYVRQAR